MATLPIVQDVQPRSLKGPLRVLTNVPGEHVRTKAHERSELIVGARLWYSTPAKQVRVGMQASFPALGL